MPHCLEYRSQFGPVPDYGIRAANEIERVILEEGPDTVGGICLEPITAGGGASRILPAPVLLFSSSLPLPVTLPLPHCSPRLFTAHYVSRSLLTLALSFSLSRSRLRCRLSPWA